MSGQGDWHGDENPKEWKIGLEEGARSKEERNLGQGKFEEDRTELSL